MFMYEMYSLHAFAPNSFATNLTWIIPKGQKYSDMPIVSVGQAYLKSAHVHCLHGIQVITGLGYCLCFISLAA